MHQRSSLSVEPALARQMSTALPFSAMALSALACLSGCGEAYNLGADEAAAGQEEARTCDVVVGGSGTVFVQTQAEVDALSGCRELPGNLFIDLPDHAESLTLAPLAELEVVRGLLAIEGPMTSLAGLEALEQVSGLSLDGLLVSDLTPLRGLRSIHRQPDYRRIGGAITITSCDQLVDLAGLENVGVWESLQISGMPNLESLSGLQSPSRADTVEITDSPRLSDVRALASLEELTGFLLSGTAIASFGSLRLELADYMNIADNPLLTNLDGLDQLTTVGTLGIGGNAALLRVDLPALDDFDSIAIVGNAVLEAVPHYAASSGNWVQPAVSPADLSYFRLPRSSFEVGDNPQLRSIVLPTEYSDIERVAIYQNPSLTSLDLGYLRRSEGLAIQDNAVLGSALAPALERVSDLAIRNNPALSVAPFAGVQTFSRDVSGNLDELP